MVSLPDVQYWHIYPGMHVEPIIMTSGPLNRDSTVGP